MLELAEKWEIPQTNFEFQGNMQKWIIAKSYFHIISEQTQ